jgi:outer membrane protein insertion porin family
MYRFGGATTLRGYRENQFLGSRIAWTNAEYRFILARHSYFFGFFDTGYYFRPADNVSSVPGAESFRYGYGIGIRMDSPLGNIGVSFALGQGDSFSTAKIHIGLLNEF